MNKKVLRLIIAVVLVASVLLITMPEAQASSSLLRMGDSGSEVQAMQKRLQDLGYADYPTALGNFGPQTRTAVIRFQSNNGLASDGVAGPLTLSRLYSGSATRLLLREGSSGEAVQTLQLQLKKLGFFQGTGTGYFGPVTREAVISFQRANGLSADGIAGPLTRIAAFSGSASTQPSAQPAQPAAPAATAIADIALTQLGKPYTWGGNGPSSYDCSGLAYYAMTQAGYSVSRFSAAGYSGVSSWDRINGTSSLAKGDLVFFRSDDSSSISHMGIYTGNDEFVHASSGQARVMVSSLSNSYWARNYLFARRLS